MPRVELFPTGKVFEVRAGAPLREVLFEAGFEFPCGGHGRCRGCRVRLLHGEIQPGAADQRLLRPAAIADGWRLACQATVTGDLKLEAAQWEMPVLGDDSAFAFSPREGLGAAIDLGTTTVVAQLLDRRTGEVLGVATALNAQAQHGADLMTRLDFAVRGGAGELARLVREQLGGMLRQLAGTAAPELAEVVIAGNTAMHHLFAALPLDSLAAHPFEAADPGLQQFEARDLGWGFPKARISFLPCLGGFVGSDLLAGILATSLHLADEPVALLDLGTNGEILVGDRHRILCASTAAGPAFEGARISMGMRAATGAIAAVRASEGGFACEVLGGGPARGVCGSGLVDAVAVGLELKAVLPSGRFSSGSSLHLRDGVTISQPDVRELQLAKAAIAAGLHILARERGLRCEELARIHLAGAFGNYINQAGARRIGLLPAPQDRIAAAGNTALLGAKMALFRDDLEFAELRSKVSHLSLNEHPDFQDLFVEQMAFPEM
jgi:uncharacterized 2Fe-2S/4Fe-4S cluster protein (DUF4445 family)